MLTPASWMKVSTGSSTLARTQQFRRIQPRMRLVRGSGVGQDAVRQDDADPPAGSDPLHRPLDEQLLGRHRATSFVPATAWPVSLSRDQDFATPSAIHGEDDPDPRS